MSQGKTFSESWHRIANVKACLSPAVKIQKQVYQQEIWYVLNDTFNNQFFRIKPNAYHFVAHMEIGSTIEETWEKVIALNPEASPGQEDVMQLLTQLHVSNMLYYDSKSDNNSFFNRYKKRKTKELNAQLLSFMFLKIPLVDPDVFLKKTLPYLKFLFSYGGFAVWITLILLASKVAIENVDKLFDQTNAILAPSNLVLLYIGMVIIKTLHELGHSYVCRYYGGAVHTLGVMLIIFVPLPYMDATSSWSFRSRRQRIFVAAAGMVVELFIAAIAVLVWANTAPGTINSLAYNMIFVASVSTVLFNANPLLRFDGYFMLSHLLDIPNLYTKAQQEIFHVGKKYLLKIKNITAPSVNRTESFWMIFYAIISTIYRVILFTSIVLFVANEYLIIGILMAIFMSFLWLIKPPYSLVKFLLTSPTLERNRMQAIIHSVLLLGLIVSLLAFIPVSDSFRSPGVVESADYLNVTTEVDGYIDRVITSSGQMVRKGDPLMTLKNRNFDQEKRVLEAQWDEILNQESKSRFQNISDMNPILERKKSLVNKMTQIDKRIESLVIKAKQDGRWVSPQINEIRDTWVRRGTSIGFVIDEDNLLFTAVISQEDASRIFMTETSDVEVKLNGQSTKTLQIDGFEMIPHDQKILPSPALGWHGGGDIAVSQQPDKQNESQDPFFRIIAKLKNDEDNLVLHGQSGLVRIQIGSTPLLWQWERKLRQLLQNRFQL